MTEKRTLKDMERLVEDLGKKALEGSSLPKKEKAERPGWLRRTFSRLIQSEATRRVKELEVAAIERKQAKELQKALERKRLADRDDQGQRKIHEVVEKFLKE